MAQASILRICNDNKIRKQSLEVFGNLGMKPKEQMKTWLFLREFLLKVRSFALYLVFNDPRSYLWVDDRDGFPLSPYKLLTDADKKRICDRDTLAEQAVTFEYNQAEEKNKEPWFAGPVKWATYGLGAVLCFILLAVFLSRVNGQEIIQNLGGFLGK